VTFLKNGSAGRRRNGSGRSRVGQPKKVKPRQGSSRRSLELSKGTERPIKIGEAANLVGVEPYVLRFWETQFPFIRPKLSRSRHRFYSSNDIDTLRFVKHLLHTEGYTIAGARKLIRERGLDGVKNAFSAARPSASNRTKQREHLRSSVRVSTAENSLPISNNAIERTLREIRDDLRELHRLLEND
jgi:DNA-binding transcriptional MerR regulator